MAEELTEEQIDGFKEAFALFDKDGDGSITINEIEIVMKSMGQHVERPELQDMINEFDVDGNGQIDFPEFLEMMRVRFSCSTTNDELRASFFRYDIDGDGLISAEDMRETQESLGLAMTEEEVEQLFEKGDLDEDGFLNFEQFSKLYNGK